ncbi:MAG: hypothetical protein J6U86_02095 [Clostridia bacterium]|nr:hypothetical protein [Clostridia bacterium]
MMTLKRIICALLSMLCIFTVVSCNKQEEAEDTQKQANTADDSVSYYVEYNGVRIELGASADEIINALGEYKDKREIGDCGGLGSQVKYSYSSFEVYVLESKANGNVIDQITFRDDLLSTPEGVYIGMSVADAKAKLGEPTASKDASIEYVDGSKLLMLGIKDGVVSEIDYMTITE